MLLRLPYALLVAVWLTTPLLAQKKPAQPAPRPKLVVGITVDQMRYDYLYRYADKYSAGGFKRLMREGFNAKNCHYPYFPTVTAAGHAAIFTGSVPAVNGIVGNEWFDQRSGRGVYCVEDSTVRTTGGSTSKAGWMSPRNLLTSTITDQLKIVSPQSKIVGIAFKDRGSILPAGHAADAAYWFDSRTGEWISSTYYFPEVPDWVKAFNAKKLPNAYLKDGWKPLLALNQYTESTADDVVYESKFAGEAKPVFPHELAATAGGERFGVIATTPFGNSLTKDFALEALKAERLGKDDVTDFLCVSFSSTDYVGHAFGPNSIEIEDTYLRLDRDMAELLTTLDREVGAGQYLVFLSADHGVADVVGFSQSLRIPSGVFNFQQTTTAAKAALKAAFGEGDFIRNQDNYQLYLDHDLLRSKNLTVAQVTEALRPAVMAQPGVAAVVNLHDLRNAPLLDHQLSFIQNGYHLKRSGDVFISLEPGWFAGRSTGTTHSSFYNYDTHVPCLFYGWRVPQGESTVARTSVADITPTVAALLQILEPNGCVGNPIEDLFD
jgi:predicted AlkP superfamily pyrophosphatase or phosphodiesterase